MFRRALRKGIDLLAAALVVGLAAPSAAHVSVQPPAVSVYTLTPERIAATVAAVVGLIGAVIGGSALALLPPHRLTTEEATPLGLAAAGLPFLLRRFRLARPVEGDRLANERLERGLVNFFSFVDVDRAAYVSVETRVEETGRILQRRALGEGQLHDVLVGFASADDAVVRPDRRAGFGCFDPLPLLDDVRVCVLDERAHSAESFPAPVPEFGDSLRDEVRCRLALARTRLFHVLILRAHRHGLQAAPAELREPPEHAGARRKAPRLRAIAHREVGDERRAEGDGEAGVGPLLEPRRHRRKQQHHAEELGPRELHPEVVGEAEVGERLRHLRQAQLRVGGEAYLQAEERGDDPEADDDAFGAGDAQVSGPERRPRRGGRVPEGLARS